MRIRTVFSIAGVAGALFALGACVVSVKSGGDSDGGSGGSAGGGGSGGGGGTGAAAGTGGGGSGGTGGTAGQGGGGSGGTGGSAGQGGGGTGGTGGSGGCQPGGPNDDVDKDGFTPAKGDCDDCDPGRNPGAYDFPGNKIDEDCSGTADDEKTNCDAAVAIDTLDPVEAANALGICRNQTKDSWGIVSAKWVFPDGTTSASGGCTGKPPVDLSHGVLTKFGAVIKPREGKAVLALSSGVAREGKNPGPSGTSPDGANMCPSTATPPGFPIDSPSCSVQTSKNPIANDGIGLEVEIRVPTNVKGFNFDFDFYTFEWPSYVCTQYNDFFVALLYSKWSKTPQNKNISFDSKNNPVSVNNGFVEVCNGPAKAGGKDFPCAKGTSELDGTGFESHAATSWLRTVGGVVPGETMKIRFAVWDAGDHILDSTVVMDNFQWTQDEPAGGPSTGPAPPK